MKKRGVQIRENRDQGRGLKSHRSGKSHLLQRLSIIQRGRNNHVCGFARAVRNGLSLDEVRA